jgi:cytidylate kinase
MEKKIITISREFGSGGRTVGRMVADRLGIPFYDKELVDQVALESGFAPKFIEEHGEHSPGSSLFSYAFIPQGVPGVMNGLSTADFLWNIQCSVILQLADKGPCVIVGRNADYILKDRDDCLHAYIHADMDFRADRIVRLYGESEKSPQARLQEKDKRRRVNYQHYTGRSWGQAQNYDICLDSGRLGVEQCADIIIGMVEKSK